MKLEARGLRLLFRRCLAASDAQMVLDWRGPRRPMALSPYIALCPPRLRRQASRIYSYPDVRTGPKGAESHYSSSRALTAIHHHRHHHHRHHHHRHHHLLLLILDGLANTRCLFTHLPVYRISTTRQLTPYLTQVGSKQRTNIYPCPRLQAPDRHVPPHCFPALATNSLSHPVFPKFRPDKPLQRPDSPSPTTRFSHTHLF